MTLEYFEYEDRDYYAYSIYDHKKKGWISKERVPKENVLYLMRSIREFVKKNNMPFRVFPISNERICVRNCVEILESKDRVLYKSILKTTNMYRYSNPVWDLKALCYYFYEWGCDDIIDVSFDKNKIKEAFQEYAQKYENVVWSDSLIV